jgi:hypothetical protein
MGQLVDEIHRAFPADITETHRGQEIETWLPGDQAGVDRVAVGRFDQGSVIFHGVGALCLLRANARRNLPEFSQELLIQYVINDAVAVFNQLFSFGLA